VRNTQTLIINDQSFNSVEVGGRGQCVHEDVVLGEFLDVLLDLSQLLLTGLLLLLFADSVDLLNVRDLLVLLVNDFPLLLESRDELLALVLGHQELLFVSLVLFLYLHLAHHLVLILNFTLDFLDILWNLTEVLLFEVVLLGVDGELGCGEDVLNSISHDVVLVTYQSHNGLLVLLGDGGSLHVVLVLELSEGAGVGEHWVAGALLTETGGFRLQGALGLADGERGTTL